MYVELFTFQLEYILLKIFRRYYSTPIVLTNRLSFINFKQKGIAAILSVISINIYMFQKHQNLFNQSTHYAANYLCPEGCTHTHSHNKHTHTHTHVHKYTGVSCKSGKKPNMHLVLKSYLLCM